MTFEISIVVHSGNTRISGDFTTPDGVTALHGPPGAGKTAVLDAVAGLLRPERGRIAVDGMLLFDSELGIDVPPEERACGYVFQQPRLFPHFSVRENLLYGWRFAPERRRTVQPEQAVALLGIGHLLDHMPRALSRVEARRVAIGRALLCGPRFLLMDEPLGGLDTRRGLELMEQIERIRDELRLPILYAGQDREELDRLADQIIPINCK